LKTIAKRLELQYPVYDTDVSANVTRLHEQLVQNVRPALLVLLGAVGLVLLIACTNVAGLSLARSNERRREIAVRTAMGAGRLRIARQLLTESVLLALAGGAAGLLVAVAGVPALVRLASNSVPDMGPVEVDYRVLLFAAGVVVLAGILFGLAPVVQSARLDLRSALNDASRGSTVGSGTTALRKLLVIGEIALALILLVGAGLLLRSFEQLQVTDPGFHPGHLLVADLPLSPQAHSKSPERMQFCDRLIQRAADLPGIVSVGAATNLPVSGGGSLIHFNIEARPPKSGHDYIVVGYRPVSARYLETLQVPLLRGRFLRDTDTDTTPFVVVVNESMEKRFFPAESALGKHVQLGALPNTEVPKMEVVGVVADMKQNLATDPAAEMYLPYRQADTMLPVFGMSLVLRTTNDPRAAISSLRQAVHSLDPNQPLVKIRTMEENISTNVSEPRFRTVLLCLFAASALLLSLIGLYGLMMYSTVQRTPEFGIRMTLGATSKQVLRMMLAQGLELAIAGVVLGMAGAYALSRVLTKFLYHVSPADPMTYVLIPLLLIAVAMAACWIPARRAMRVDPTTALRYE
jgi:putative ABC transport system permease protein